MASVQNILDTVVESLAADPNRKFSYAEMVGSRGVQEQSRDGGSRARYRSRAEFGSRAGYRSGAGYRRGAGHRSINLSAVGYGSRDGVAASVHSSYTVCDASCVIAWLHLAARLAT